MFMPCTLCQLYGLLRIQMICATIYHLQTDGQFANMLVPKVDRSISFYADLRNVNAVPKFSVYPISIDKLLNYWGVTCFYSTRDITMGYWQISWIPLFWKKKKPLPLSLADTNLFRTLETLQQFMDRIFHLHIVRVGQVEVFYLGFYLGHGQVATNW